MQGRGHSPEAPAPEANAGEAAEALAPPAGVLDEAETPAPPMRARVTVVGAGPPDTFETDAIERAPPNTGTRLATRRVLVGLCSSSLGVLSFAFIALLGGKVGLSLVQSMCIIGGWAIMDLACRCQIANDAQRPLGREYVFKRAACWLAVALLRGVMMAGYGVSLDRTHARSSWQIVLMLFTFGQYFVVEFGLVSTYMLQAHRDVHPNVWRLWFVQTTFHAGIGISACTPYTALERLARTGNLLVTIGYVVLAKDRDAVHSSVLHSYMCRLEWRRPTFSSLLCSSQEALCDCPKL